MGKRFLLNTSYLAIALAVVLTIIIAAATFNFGGDAAGGPRNQTFFEQFVIAGGPIVWFVLLPMSLITFFLAAEHSLTIRRSRILPESTGVQIIRLMQQFGPAQLEAKIAERRDFVSVAVAEAITKGRGDWFRMRSVLAESLQEQALKLLRRIEWLHLIGNVSPMVGLFGTVFGMIKLFNAIVIAGGQPQPAHLAGGISVALVTTFWGLSIAIPALGLHSVFRNRIETMLSDAIAEADNVMHEIRRSLKKQKLPERPQQPIEDVAGRPVKATNQSIPLR
ncbi:MAG: MotA/TolQ/ExbB proton channel family protein [Planctomycetota bacterium]